MLLAVLTLAITSHAAVPPAAQLLPADTLAVISVPDWDQALTQWNRSSYGRLWDEPALSAFKQKALDGWKKDLAGPLERALGIKLADYFDLLHGQVTVGVTPNGWGTQPGAALGVTVLIDAKDKQDLLTQRLASFRKAWIDSGKGLKTDRVQNVEVTTLVFTPPQWRETMEKAFPGRKAAAEEEAEEGDELENSPKGAPARNTEITFGQSGSLLIVSNHPRAIEGVLVRQGGGLAPALAEQSVYQANHGALFRDALGFGWIHFARVYETIAKQLAESSKGGKDGNPIASRPDKLLGALGLNGLKTISLRFGGNAEGDTAEAFLTIPESGRQGVFRLLTLGRKEAGPPAFVGADVVKFSRWRLDGQKAWSTVENMLTSISPELAGLLQMGLQAAGKDKDPSFDLKKTLVGNLGDDFVLLQKNPTASSKASEAPAARSLVLIGSPSADQFVQGVKVASALMPLAGGEPDLAEREFLGKKIYSLAMPSLPGPDAPKGETARKLSFASAGGYAALSTDEPILEEYLRSGEAGGKTLREAPGFNDAAEKVGGTSTGYFGYENQLETTRVWFDAAKKENAGLEKLLPPLARQGLGADDPKGPGAWFDASLLPSFDRIAKYFHFVVYSLGSTDEGLSWKFFAPRPPKLNQ